jgi:hypothetical protein
MGELCSIRSNARGSRGWSRCRRSTRVYSRCGHVADNRFEVFALATVVGLVRYPTFARNKLISGVASRQGERGHGSAKFMHKSTLHPNAVDEECSGMRRSTAISTNTAQSRQTAKTHQSWASPAHLEH